MERVTSCQVAIIGAGISGMTCALYLARAGVDTALIGDWTTAPILASPEIRNYPGTGKISGYDLLSNLNQQVQDTNTKIIAGIAAKPTRQSDTWVVLVDTGDIVEADSLVIATGASPKLLNLENEQELIGKAVSTCAYCDGPLYAGKKVCVVGSGTTAIEEALYLSKIAHTVTVLCRKNKFSTSLYTPEQLGNYPNIQLMFDTQIKSISLDGHGSVIVQLSGNRSRMMLFDGIFYAIGSSPNTEFLGGMLPVDHSGHIDLAPESERIYRVYACGDVNARSPFKQAIVAAADGCETAMRLLCNLRK